jgi:hypothetical protein
MDHICGTRLENFIDSICAESVDIIVDKYPLELDEQVLKAEQLVKQGKFESAICIYLDIFENVVYADLMCNLYKVLLCEGLFFYAYLVIDCAERAIVEKLGKNVYISKQTMSLNYADWRETEYKKELVKFSNDIVQKDNYYGLLEYLRSISSDPEYVYPISHYQIRLDMEDINFFSEMGDFA